ncbi:hypothetical protein BHE74_00011971 [Ensete ventricosum]|nr:hypothetical protein BHE74_00011971 [Ensete ventricosum]
MRNSGLQADKKLMAQLLEATNRLELSDRDLNDIRADLSEAQRELKEQWAGHRKADDDLLKAIRELETQRTELPKKKQLNTTRSRSPAKGLRGNLYTYLSEVDYTRFFNVVGVLYYDVVRPRMVSSPSPTLRLYLTMSCAGFSLSLRQIGHTYARVTVPTSGRMYIRQVGHTYARLTMLR